MKQTASRSSAIQDNAWKWCSGFWKKAANRLHLQMLRDKLLSLPGRSEKGRNCETNPIFNANYYQPV